MPKLKFIDAFRRVRDSNYTETTMQPRNMRWRVTVTSTVGALLAALGAALAICWDDIFYSILQGEMKLTPTSKGYEIWREPPIPMFLDFYFFNWTNPDEITNSTSKPRMVEMGPYRFKETKEKVNITWHSENSTVSFRQLRRWYYVESESNGNLDDNITTLNVIAASAVYSARNQNYLRQKGIHVGLAMFHETVSVTRTVRELLFDGYRDSLLDLAQSLPSSETNAPTVDRFGWFYKRNGSIENDGYFNMATGVANMDDFGVLKNWNNMSATNYFEGECGKVNGSAGEFFPSKLSYSDHISLFSADICRPMSFDYDETVYVENIAAYKFSSGDRLLDNGTVFEGNRCFCPGECQPSGAINVSSCRYGSPAFVSLPHFYLGDPYYTDSVDGLKPDKDKHNFFLALEPTSGIPLDVAARLQLNILIDPNPNIGLYSNVQKVYLPILWFEQRVTLSGDLVGNIKLMLAAPLIGNIVALSLFAIGIVILVWTPIRINIKACLKSRQLKSNSREDKSKRIVLNNMREPKENVCMLPSAKDEEAVTKMRESLGGEAEEALTTANNIV